MKRLRYDPARSLHIKVTDEGAEKNYCYRCGVMRIGNWTCYINAQSTARHMVLFDWFRAIKATRRALREAKQ